MINVVLMAGHGKRFQETGYKQSKPLIPVNGKPMILQAVKSMPKADRWVFVVREEHLLEFELMKTLKSVAEDVRILVDPNPIGQLNSCLVAKDCYDNDEPLFVGACDLGMKWNQAEYEKLDDDMIVWSFTKQDNLTRNPQAWGWLKQEDNIIKGVSVKVPISDDPFNDQAIVGSFSFKSGKLFLELAEELIKTGKTVKGEYYIDSMIETAVQKGLKVKSFPVDEYIGWGTPQDLEKFNLQHLSIIIPCYNEAENIPLVLDKFDKILTDKSKVELILVDNNSKDNTKEVLAQELPKYPFARTVFEEKAGYGAAVTKGIKEAKYEYVCLSHADLQTNPADVLKAQKIMQKEENPKKCFIKGNRKNRPFKDSFFTWGMGIFETVVLQKKLFDIHAQPNLFHKELFEEMKFHPENFSFDVYIYYLAQKNGFKTIRFPVKFPERIHGESSWNSGLGEKTKFIKRTIDFTIGLKKEMKKFGSK